MANKGRENGSRNRARKRAPPFIKKFLWVGMGEGRGRELNLSIFKKSKIKTIYFTKSLF